MGRGRGRELQGASRCWMGGRGERNVQAVTYPASLYSAHCRFWHFPLGHETSGRKMVRACCLRWEEWVGISCKSPASRVDPTKYKESYKAFAALNAVNFSGVDLEPPAPSHKVSAPLHLPRTLTHAFAKFAGSATAAAHVEYLAKHVVCCQTYWLPVQPLHVVISLAEPLSVEGRAGRGERRT